MSRVVEMRVATVSIAREQAKVRGSEVESSRAVGIAVGPTYGAFKAEMNGLIPDDSSAALRLRVPGRLVPDRIGLGDAIKHFTRALGISPCSACEHRAEALNRWLVFERRKNDSP